MVKRTQILELGRLVDAAKTILLLQPDRPDGDSLGSMLALEEIFGEMGKTVIMYTAGRIEPYLQYLPGSDRVRIADDFPSENWDLAILVDTGSPDQVARLLSDHHAKLNRKPWAIIDHHASRSVMEGVSLTMVDPAAAATSELLYRIATPLKWPLSQAACERLLSSLFADTLNLTTSSVSTRTATTYAALIKTGGVNVSKLHQAFREASANDPDLLAVKGELLQSVELYGNNRIALVVAPREMVKTYRERVSLGSLVLYELLWARGIQVAAVMSDYGTIVRTSLRAKVPVAGPVATRLGGGGHAMAAAFSNDKDPIEDVKERLILELVAELDRPEA